MFPEVFFYEKPTNRTKTDFQTDLQNKIRALRDARAVAWTIYRACPEFTRWRIQNKHKNRQAFAQPRFFRIYRAKTLRAENKCGSSL